MNGDCPAIQVSNLSHDYGDKPALDGLELSVATKSITGILGPNGCGKTTFFRILTYLLPLQSGEIRIFGKDHQKHADLVRRALGVTFQSPSLDVRLNVRENLRHQGHLYGLRGRELHRRIDRLLEQMGIADRASELVQNLSGGLKRRAEIAKGILHDPQLILMDEPSTGLDPGSRLDLWSVLRRLKEEGMTILLTTHLMEEAEHCDRLAILDRGRVVADDSPDGLRGSIGGDCLTIQCAVKPSALAEKIQSRFSVASHIVQESIRIERKNGHELLRDLIEAFPEDIQGISLGKPTLEDVFIQRTGHQFWEET